MARPRFTPGGYKPPPRDRYQPQREEKQMDYNFNPYRPIAPYQPYQPYGQQQPRQPQPSRQEGDERRATGSLPRYEPPTYPAAATGVFRLAMGEGYQAQRPYDLPQLPAYSGPGATSGFYPLLGRALVGAASRYRNVFPRRQTPQWMTQAPPVGAWGLPFYYGLRHFAGKPWLPPAQSAYHGPYDMGRSYTPQAQTAYHGPYDMSQRQPGLTSMSHQIAHFQNLRNLYGPGYLNLAGGLLQNRMQYPQAGTPFALMARGMEGPPSPAQYAPGPYYPDYYGDGRRAGYGGGGYAPQEVRRPGAGYYGSPPRSGANYENWYGQMISWNISGQ
jgi:hypothetical protein